MTDAGGVPPVTGPAPGTVVCPYLGLEDDPATHLVFPSRAQVCHATVRPSRIETAKQRRDCLTARHVGCSRYRPLVAPVAHTAVRAAIAAAQEDARAGRGTGPFRRAAAILLIIVLFGAAAIGGVAIASLAGPRTGQPGPSAPTPAAALPTSNPSAGPVEPATPSPTPLASLAQTASPASTATASPPPSPTVRPTPAPTPLVHRVRQGDTLTSIAARYGVTIAALRRLNGIADPDHIVVGQVLVIPLR